MSYKKLNVVELFAGVGGFRVGLERTNKYEVVWSNQWEPLTKFQHASLVYENVFGNKNHSNENIEKVSTTDIPNCDVIVGGFPCQDYSVATSLKSSGGIEGKKGVLWWSIDRILREKKVKPKYLILENVDRLLKSPAIQRGRDFAIMLKCLDDIGYAIEWKVINAAEYGFPQRRRRVFILGYYKGTKEYKKIIKDKKKWLLENGTLQRSFPSKKCQRNFSEGSIKNKELLEISEKFNKKGKETPFKDSGIMIKGEFISFKYEAKFTGKRLVLKDILEEKVDKSFYVLYKDLKRWKYEKGAKKKKRTTKDGYEYTFSEGAMTFPDDINKPSRTIITGEGGTAPSRFKHLIKVGRRHRRLTPIELERLNGFPDNHTHLEGITDAKRAFFMGNALVIGIIEKIGEELTK